MKKLISITLAASLLMSLSVLPASSAEPQTFHVKSCAAGQTKKYTIETGIKGITATLGADVWTVRDSNHTSPSGNTYTNSIVGKANPKPAEGVGTYYSFALDDSVESGKIEFGGEVGAGKALYITVDDTALPDYNGIKYDAKTVIYPEIDVEGGHTYTIYVAGSKMSFYGMTYRAVNPQQEFAEEIAAFSFDSIKGSNADINSVEDNLEPIQAYESKFGSCDVRWESSDETVIARDGTVNAKTADTTVSFTGYFSVQEDDSLSADKTFELTVLGDPDDESAVRTAAESLSLGDTSAVKNNIFLPLSGRKGTAVAWTSSDESIISNDGMVTRSPGEDKDVTLTAVITRGGAREEKTFTVNVLGYTPVVFNSYAYSDANGNIKYSPVDGGYLKAVNITSSIPETADGDIITVNIYDKDNALKSTKEIKLDTAVTDKDCNIEINAPMNSSDYFVINIGNKDSRVSYLSDIKADDTVKDGAAIYVVGDSTAAVYDDKNYPRKGWAQLLGNYFDDVKVVDYALSGRSSLNFKNETNYKNLQTNIKSGDYLIIQFGHNDSKAEADRYTNPAGDRFTDGSFQKSMYEYIELARDKGAKPILATSISRRRLSDAGLEAYVNAAKKLGAATLTPVLDLYKSTNEWINFVGPEPAKSMFNYVNAQDERFIGYEGFKSSGFYAAGTTDDTHININGADLISQWAAEWIAELNMPLAKSVNSYKAIYPLPEYDKSNPVPTASPKPKPSEAAPPVESEQPSETSQPEQKHRVTFSYQYVNVYEDAEKTKPVDPPYTMAADDKLYFEIQPVPGNGMVDRVSIENGSLTQLDAHNYELSNVTADTLIAIEWYSGILLDLSVTKNETGGMDAAVKAGFANASAPRGEIIVGIYDENGSLLSVKIKDMNYYENCFSWEEIPNGAKTVKAMWWHKGEQAMTPVTSPDTYTFE